MILYARTCLFVSSVYVWVFGCSFTTKYWFFGCVGLLFSIYHFRFSSLSLAKAAELSGYCPFGCAGLLFPISRYRFRSLFIQTAAELSWYCTFEIRASILHSTTTDSGCLLSEGGRTVVASYLRDFLRFYLQLEPTPAKTSVMLVILLSAKTYHHKIVVLYFPKGLRHFVIASPPFPPASSS